MERFKIPFDSIYCGAIRNRIYSLIIAFPVLAARHANIVNDKLTVKNASIRTYLFAHRTYPIGRMVLLRCRVF